MPPIAKKMKLSANSETKTNSSFIDIELLRHFQDEIRRIKVENDCDNAYENQIDSADPDEDLKSYIRDQIQQSELRVQKRLDTIEHKLDRLLEAQNLSLVERIEEEPPVEEHLVEWAEAETATVREEVVNEFDSRLFPIADEGIFDWFFERLRNEEYRHQLIQSRWQLTRNVSTKSFQISVKDFLRMHFELTICVKYSVSGYGAHGVKKKKFDCNALTNYVFECFNRGYPEKYTFQEVNKAIVQFWGRAPDTLHKSMERSLKQDSSVFVQSFDEVC